MKNFRKGDNVLVPIGTPTSFFSGSILDKNPFKQGKIEYNLIGKIIDINSKNASVEPWHNRGTGYCGILNFNPKYLKFTDLILRWDENKQCQRVLFKNEELPKDFKEYEVDIMYCEGNTYTEIGEYVFARDRKHALELGRESGKTHTDNKIKVSARLWKGHKPKYY